MSGALERSIKRPSFAALPEEVIDFPAPFRLNARPTIGNVGSRKQEKSKIINKPSSDLATRSFMRRSTRTSLK